MVRMVRSLAHRTWELTEHFELRRIPRTWEICTRRAGKLYRARYRRHRSRSLQLNTHLKALAEIYTIHPFAPLSNLTFFVEKIAKILLTFVNILLIFVKILLDFDKISAEFHRNLPNRQFASSCKYCRDHVCLSRGTSRSPNSRSVLFS